MDAAVEVFATVGYNKGSLREVADRVGMSQAGLLHHFPSKEHLLEAVLTWRDDDARALLGDPRPTGWICCAAWSGWRRTTPAARAHGAARHRVGGGSLV